MISLIQYVRFVEVFLFHILCHGHLNMKSRKKQGYKLLICYDFLYELLLNVKTVFQKIIRNDYL